METSFGGQKTKFNPYQNGGVQILNALLLEKLTLDEPLERLQKNRENKNK